MTGMNGALDPRRWHQPRAERDDIPDRQEDDLFAPVASISKSLDQQAANRPAVPLFDQPPLKVSHGR